MTRPTAVLPAGLAIDLPAGGVVETVGDPLHAPSEAVLSDTSAAFGPLSIGVPGDTTVSLSGLSFLPAEDSGLPLIGLGLVAGASAGTADGRRVTRRGVLGALGAALLVGKTRAADDETATLQIAELEIARSTGPVTLAVDDRVDGVLPTTTDILVDVDGVRVGTATATDGVTLPTGTTGRTRVYLKDSIAMLSSLLAKARGLVDYDETVVYQGQLPAQASQYDEGETITLTAHPTIVGPVRESDADRVAVTVGDDHLSRESSPAGSYSLSDGALVYSVGADPPDSATWRVRARMGLIESVRNRDLL